MLPPLPPGLDPALAVYLQRLADTIQGTGLNVVPASLEVARRLGLNLAGAAGATLPETPAAPVGLTATPLVAGVLLSWGLPEDPSVKSFEVERATTSAFTDGAVIARLAGTIYVDGETPVGAERHYRVRSVRDTGETSAWAGPVSTAPKGVSSSDLQDAAVTQAKIEPGALALDRLARDAGIETGGFGYGLSVTFNSSGRRRTYRQLTLTGDVRYVIQTGDVLEYDIFFDSGSADTRGGVDLLKTGGDPPHVLRDVAGVVDTTGLSAHPSTQLGVRGRWLHRSIPLPSAWVGRTLTGAAMGVEEAPNGTTTFAVKALTITNGKTDSAKKVRYSLDRHTFSTFPVWRPYGDQLGVQTVDARRLTLGHAVATDNVVSAAVTRGGQVLPADINSVTSPTNQEVEFAKLTLTRLAPNDSTRLSLDYTVTAAGTSDGTNAGGTTMTVRLYRSMRDLRDPATVVKLHGNAASVSWSAGKGGNFGSSKTYKFSFVDLPVGSQWVGLVDYYLVWELTPSGVAASRSGSVTGVNFQLWGRSA